MGGGGGCKPVLVSVGRRKESGADLPSTPTRSASAYHRGCNGTAGQRMIFGTTKEDE